MEDEMEGDEIPLYTEIQSMDRPPQPLIVPEAQFNKKMFLQHLLSGWIPFYEFWVHSRPFIVNKYMMQYSLGFLLVAFTCMAISASRTVSIFLQNALFCHFVFVLVIATRRAVMCTAPHEFKPPQKFWGSLITSQLVAAGHVYAIYIDTTDNGRMAAIRVQDMIPNVYLCTAADWFAMASIYIAVGGYMYAFFKSVAIFTDRYNKLDRLGSITHPPTQQKLQNWKYARFDIDTSRPDEMLRLVISFLGTASILAAILAALLINRAFRDLIADEISFPTLFTFSKRPWVFYYDAAIIFASYVIWNTKIGAYEAKIKAHVDMLERHISFLRDISAPMNTINAYTQTQHLIESKMGILSNSAVQWAHSISTRILQFLFANWLMSYLFKSPPSSSSG